MHPKVHEEALFLQEQEYYLMYVLGRKWHLSAFLALPSLRADTNIPNVVKKLAPFA